MAVNEFCDKLNNEYQKDCAHTNTDKPWFGHVLIQSQETVHAYKVSSERNLELRIIDWLHPIAKSYYDCEPGDPFAMSDYQRDKSKGDLYANIEGEVTQQATVSKNHGRMAQEITLATTDGQFIMEHNGESYEKLDNLSARFAATESLPDVRAMLSKAQYKLITSSDTKPIIIQGQAGSGKTTVALYRLCWLANAENNNTVPVDPKNILIVMFNKALQTYVGNALTQIKLGDAKVDTFHNWAINRVQEAYKGKINFTAADDLNKIDKEAAERLKKQAGILKALDEFVDKQTARMFLWLEKTLAPYNQDELIEQLKSSSAPIVQRLIQARKKVSDKKKEASGREADVLNQTHNVLAHAVNRMTRYKEELFDFAKDTELLKKHLPDETDEAFKQLESFQTELQRKDKGSGRVGPFISYPDVALLLRLIQIKHGGFPRKNEDEPIQLYDHLVIDEAQDFGAVEMIVLLSSAKSKSGVTIVGDVNQKIVPSARFMGWDKLAGLIGIEGAEVSKLEVPHRSTAAIMKLANSVLGEFTEDEHSIEGRSGTVPLLIQTQDEHERIQVLSDLLGQVMTKSPQSHICIVCYQVTEAQQLSSELMGALPDLDIRYAYRGDFEFRPGITVTNLHQIKGLEFDSVVLVNPDERRFSASEQGRKYLYTAITRAKEEFFVIGNGTTLELLKPAVEQGLIHIQDESIVEEAELVDEDIPF